MFYAPLRSFMSTPFYSSFIFDRSVRVARFDFHLANMSVIIEIFADWIEVNVRVTLSFPILLSLLYYIAPQISNPSRSKA